MFQLDPADLTIPGLALTATWAAPQLAPGPTNINFGDVHVQAKATQTVTIENDYKQTVLITSIAVKGAGYSWRGIRLPYALRAGKSAVITVTFAPTATGTVPGTISVKGKLL